MGGNMLQGFLLTLCTLISFKRTTPTMKTDFMSMLGIKHLIRKQA